MSKSELFVISVKTEIQMFDNTGDSHFRGNDNSAIITIDTTSIFYLSRIPDNVGISDQMIASFDHQHFLRSRKVPYSQLIEIYSTCKT